MKKQRLLMFLFVSAALFFASCEKDDGTDATGTINDNGGASPTSTLIVGQWNLTNRMPDELENLHSLWTFSADGTCSMKWYQNDPANEDDGYEEKGTYTMCNDTIYFVAITEAEYTYFIENVTDSTLSLLFVEEESRYTFERVDN